MDMDKFKDNVKQVIKIMPPEIQLDVGQLFHIVIKHLPQLEKLLPQAHVLLAEDIHALGFEFISGMLDREKLSAVLTAAFAECGIVLPEASAPVPKG